MAVDRELSNWLAFSWRKKGILEKRTRLRPQTQRKSMYIWYSSSIYCCFSGLSLVLNKADCDWTRQTLNPSELIGERPAKPELIHTSCRSESSNISLVVLDKATACPNATHSRLKSGIHFSGEPSSFVRLIHLSPRFTLSGWRPTWLSPWSWGG